MTSLSALLGLVRAPRARATRRGRCARARWGLLGAGAARGCRALLLALSCGLAASSPRAARAGADVRIIALNPSTCAATSQDDAALLHALETELSSLPLAASSTPAQESAARVVVSVECTAHTDAVTLRIRSSASGHVEQRSLVLRDVPAAARARLLALVVAEALGSELAPPASEPEVRPPLPASRRAAPARKRLRQALFTTRDPYPGGAYDTTSASDALSQPPALRLAVGSQARLALAPSALLFAFEASASGPIERYIGWGVEASYASVGDAATERGELDVHWLNASAGFDFIVTRRADIVVGPRLSVGYLSASRDDTLLDAAALDEATLGTQLGARATFTSHLGGETALAVTFAAQRTLGVAALGPYTGLDSAFHGWIISWGLGLAIEP